MTHFLSETLRWKDDNGQIVTYTDNLTNEKRLYIDIRKQLDDMFNSIQKIGNNSFTLNFFALCGSGFVNL